MHSQNINNKQNLNNKQNVNNEQNINISKLPTALYDVTYKSILPLAYRLQPAAILTFSTTPGYLQVKP